MTNVTFRTAITAGSSYYVSIGHKSKLIQDISGHNDLGVLKKYLEVGDEERKKAVCMIGF